MRWVYSDGGRQQAGYKGQTGDCVARAIAIVTEIPYEDVCADIDLAGKDERISKRKKGRSTSQKGVYTATIRRYLASLDFVWVSTMGIGTGCQVHLQEWELPKGRLIVRLSKHVAAVINGTIYDTFDPSREGTRCVYGYWVKKGSL